MSEHTAAEAAQPPKSPSFSFHLYGGGEVLTTLPRFNLSSPMHNVNLQV